ncbi:MAG TPA: AsmA family protein [Candidatus Sulfotelmatobacter sp.]|jgi:uncharacterized protein involved in outer membrane biogenesis|nr:AsmA family protein [Candidatus Sulfotelmatobacter sp.]
MRVGLIIKLALAGVVMLAVALIAVAKSIDVSAYRQLLAQAAKDATGRDLTINGRLSLRLSLNPALVARDVVLSNAAWDKDRPLLRAGRLEANIGLVALLGRRVNIRRLAVEDADLLLENNAKGQGNWEFGETKGVAPGSLTTEGTPTGFSIAQLAFNKVHVTYRDAASGRNDEVSIDRLTLDAPIPGAPVGLLSVGTWNGRHYDVSGTLGSAGEFNDFMNRNESRSFPVKLKAVLPGLVATADGSVSGGRGGPFLLLKMAADSADLAETGKLIGVPLPALGAARINMMVKGALSSPVITDLDAALGRRDAAALTLKGAIRDPLSMKGVDLLLTAEGPSLAGFNKSLGVTLPAIGPLKAQARFGDLADGWRLGDLKATVGKSDLSGDVVFRLSGKRPDITARLSSNSVSLEELSPDAGKDKAGDMPDARLFPDQPLPFALLQMLDLDLEWKIERLTDNLLLAQMVQLSARLKDGKLSAQPSVAMLAGGKAKADIQVDVTGRQPLVQLSVDADKVGLGEVLRSFKVADTLRGGSSDLRLRLSGTGATPHAIMARASGESLLVTGKGRVEGVYADALALDLLKQLAPWVQEKDTEMQCLVSRFIITDGLAKSDALLFDTTRMTVAGQGSVNLGSETLDLTLSPKPKETSLLSLSVPVDVQGTLTQPVLSPNKGAIVKGVVGAVGGLALGPLGALVPLVSSGTGSANPCLAAIAQTRKPVAGRAPAKGKAKSKNDGGGLGGLLQGLIGD